MNLEQWAARWNIPPAAFAELVACSIVAPDGVVKDGSEAWVQSTVRLEAGRASPPCYLWRNNCGAGKMATGAFIRWGLANDSKKLNEVMKSADLIGIRPLTITPAMVGLRIAQFISRECKRSDWIYRGTAEDNAQVAWATLINSLGGDARIVRAAGSL